MWNSFGNMGYGFHGGFGYGFGILGIWLLIVLALKGYCLWHAAKRNEIWWFLALFILNTLGILELVYIIFFLKKFSMRSEAQTMKADSTSHSDHTHTS